MSAIHEGGGSRTHLVLVPGFAGFDALGQIRYYTGVTRAFRPWLERSGHEGRPTLQYFDNFPTASVKVRAQRLREFLAKRMVRGEIAPKDAVVLIGHSTGGLDIRQLVLDLGQHRHHRTVVDADGTGVANAAMLGHIRRAVFLSAAHFGSNLAWMAAQVGPAIQRELGEAAMGVRLNQGPGARLRSWLASLVPERSPPSQLLMAIGDALDETDLHVPAGAGKAGADEREARAELLAWLDQMSHDFGALDDLRPPSGSSGAPPPASPAGLSQDQRAAELELWADRPVLSFATRAPEPAGGPALQAVHALRAVLRHGSLLVNAGSQLPGVSAAWGLALLAALQARPELAYEACHAFCADPEGPFRDPGTHASVEVVPLTADGAGPGVLLPGSIAVADNDGIVNTLSMLWPPRSRAYLVQADHADIVGHYQPLHCTVGESGRRGRRRESYDILQSSAGFDLPLFNRVWRTLFEFGAQANP
jgi:hypothetical protein